MQKAIYLLSFLLLSTGLYSQFAINLQLPAAGLYVKSQLWNMSLIHTGQEAFSARLELRLNDASNGQPVLSGTSQIFQVNKGVMQITPNLVAPILYNVLSSGYGVDANANGFLPIGTFDVCFRLILIGSHYTETVAEECETIQIEPVSPPILISPFDEEKVETRRPVFIWLPPAPQSLFNNLLYDFRLVEVQQLQSSSSAIETNIPIHFESGTSLTSLAYPIGLPELDVTKLYAWQVTAKNSGTPVSKSDIWTFSLMQYSEDTIQQFHGHYFSKLRKENDASYIICSGILSIEIHNELNQNAIDIKVTDLSSPGRSVIELDSASLPVKLGKNFLKIDLTNASLVDRHIYQLEVLNLNKEKWYLKFEFRQPNN